MPKVVQFKTFFLGRRVQNILARKKEALQIVVSSREYFLKKAKSFEKLWQNTSDFFVRRN